MRKRKRRIISFAGVVMNLVLCFLLGAGQILADAWPQETDRLSIAIQYGGGAAEFSLYRVADMTENREFTLTGKFADCPVSLENLDTEGWKTAAQTLAVYAEKGKAEGTIQPDQTGKTDDEGMLKWENLGTGLYLVLGSKTEDETYLYEPTPLLAALPGWENDTWNHHVTLNPKFEKTKKPEKPTTKIAAVKIWEDDGQEDKRPESIEVQLLKNGEVYDTQKLNKENGWKYTWEKLPVDFQWSVVEKEVSESYKVTYENENMKNGKRWVIRNKVIVPPTPTPTPSETPSPTPSETPSPTPSETPTPMPSDTPAPTVTPTTTPKPSATPTPVPAKSLPYTGQTWWPVPVLACAGIMAFSIGWIRRRKWEKKNGNQNEK